MRKFSHANFTLLQERKKQSLVSLLWWESYKPLALQVSQAQLVTRHLITGPRHLLQLIMLSLSIRSTNWYSSYNYSNQHLSIVWFHSIIKLQYSCQPCSPFVSINCTLTTPLLVTAAMVCSTSLLMQMKLIPVFLSTKLTQDQMSLLTSLWLVRKQWTMLIFQF